ncbi:MAG: archaeal proteasome endopeptidase complex subunit beta [Candidatus Odinarchaeum yellowstonii]|uniref:Proteasome subunit beta n=1 Tax=Odinarchaeota yellowstonii (strain LCB_4) TaxID=1841599 RepID=A0AAF0IBH6_ODILC|nr:MAG: archaeal proteasome endopeptidase complex subunit beta [Candidatus Odinarchaeum yellowstonii]
MNASNFKTPGFQTGTTTLGIVYNEGVILASESRVSEGYYVASKTGKKVLMIDEHIGMTISGSVADAQSMVDQARALAKLYFYDKGRRMPVKAAAKLISNILFGQRPLYLMTSLLIGGVDEDGPHLYSLDAAGSLIPDKYTSTGSGSVIAYGVLEDSYKDGMSEREAIELSIRAISAAKKRDVFSGNKISVAVIDKRGFRLLSDSEIEAVERKISGQ